MSKLVFYHNETCTAIEQISRQRVAEQMGEHPLVDFCTTRQGTDFFTKVGTFQLKPLFQRCEQKIIRLATKGTEILDKNSGAFGRDIHYTIFFVFAAEDCEVVSAQVNVFTADARAIRFYLLAMAPRHDRYQDSMFLHPATELWVYLLS